LRLHAIFAPHGTPRALELRSPNADERELGPILPDRCQRHGGEVLSRARATSTNAEHGRITRPSASQSNRTSRPANTSSPSKRHPARTHAGLKERGPARFRRLAAAITPNHQPARNSRALANHRA
jgi:hypothetical protein